MDLAYFDKLATDNNGAKYLLDCQDLVDRTVDANRKRGFQRNCSNIFNHDWKEESTQKMDCQRYRNCWRVWKLEKNVPLQKVRLTMICSTYHTFVGRYSLSLHGRLWIKVQLQNRSQPWIPERTARKTWYQKLLKISPFRPLSTASHYKNVEKFKFTIWEFASPSMIYLLWKVIRKYMNFLLPQHRQHTQ